MPADRASLENMTTDQLLEFAQQTSASHNLLNTLMNDPDARPFIQRRLKALNPKLVIPEIDAVDAVTAQIVAERGERLKLEQQLRERDVRDRLERERAKIKQTYGLSDADVIEVEKLMTAEHDPIPTYDAAARVYKASLMTAVPTAASLRAPTYDMPETEVWGKGIGNKAALDKIAVNEAWAALNDIRAGKVAGLGPNALPA